MKNPALPALTTLDGREAQVRNFEIEQSGRKRPCRVAYIQAQGFLCEIELEAPNRVSFEESLPSFERVVKSFRFLNPKSGEYQAASARRTIFLFTDEIQDRIYYATPEGWEKLPGRPGVEIYQSTKGREFGLIAAYYAKPGEGDPFEDFEAAWSELAQGPFDAGPPPQPESWLNDFGWEVRVGEARVEKDGSTSFLTLAVLTGYGRRAAILSLSNDVSAAPKIDEFIHLARPALHLSRGGWTFREWNATHHYVNDRLSGQAGKDLRPRFIGVEEVRKFSAFSFIVVVCLMAQATGRVAVVGYPEIEIAWM